MSEEWKRRLCDRADQPRSGKNLAVMSDEELRRERFVPPMTNPERGEMSDIKYTSIRVPITVDNLPIGPRWEADGACWKAVIEDGEPKGWRWQPMNWEAFAKEGPEGEMTDFAQPTGLSPAKAIAPKWRPSGFRLRRRGANSTS